MTVKELRKKLRGLPEDAEVVVRVLDSDLGTHVVSCDFDTDNWMPEWDEAGIAAVILPDYTEVMTFEDKLREGGIG